MFNVNAYHFAQFMGCASSIALSLAVFIPHKARANQQVRCVTQSCDATACTKDLVNPKKVCGSICSREESVQSVVLNSNCGISWPPEDVPPQPGPPTWLKDVKACQRSLTVEEIEDMTSSDADVDPPKVNQQYISAGIPVKDGFKITEIFCHANDAYSSGWCTGGLGDHTRCDIQWSWAQKVISDRFTGNRTNVGVQFYNQSDNRWRQFRIYAKIVPE